MAHLSLLVAVALPQQNSNWLVIATPDRLQLLSAYRLVQASSNTVPVIPVVPWLSFPSP